jgi:hypothetical protein
MKCTDFMILKQFGSFGNTLRMSVRSLNQMQIPILDTCSNSIHQRLPSDMYSKAHGRAATRKYKCAKLCCIGINRRSISRRFQKYNSTLVTK